MNQDLTLLVLAAGMWSRYGGLKQVDNFGPQGETLLEYSVYDAIKAWFTKVVFVIRQEFAELFEEHVGNKLKDHIAVEYVYQDINSYIPERYATSHRLKPRGTGHAVLVAKGHLKTPFAVINADDYYGARSYLQMANFLKTNEDPTRFSLVGYVLEKTLSENGAVNRGVCTVEDNHLVSIEEHLWIIRKDQRAIQDQNGKVLSPDTVVSMNFFGFHPEILKDFEQQFNLFLEEHWTDPKKEFYIPLVCDALISQGKYVCDILISQDYRCGVTYPDDKPYVAGLLRKFIESNTYPAKLWG